MALGDRIVADGQIQWGDVLIDGLIWRGDPPAEAVVPKAGVSGLAVPDTRSVRTAIPMAAGSVAGLDLWATRKIALTQVQIRSQADLAKVLATMAPRGPSAEQELVWRGFTWPPGRRFRAFARPERPAETFDSESFGGMNRPQLAWECPDPLAYEFDPTTTAPIAPGGHIDITSIGGWASHRIQVTWNGPWVGPGISSSVVPGGKVSMATLTLAAGQQIVADFYAFHRGTIDQPLRSNHFTRRQLWQAAIGAGPSLSAPPARFFPILPGDQRLTALGTGSGTMVVEWFDAHATPALP